MMQYEKLLLKVEKIGIEVLEVNLGTNKKCGKYLANEQKNIIVINSNLTNIEKYEVLAEEFGHYKTTFGNITNQNELRNLKLENIARKESYEILAKPNYIIDALKYGATTLDEVAEHINITVETLLDVIDSLKRQYGIRIPIGSYYLYLEPHLDLTLNTDRLNNNNKTVNSFNCFI